MTTVERLDPNDDAQFAEFHATYYASTAGEWDRSYGAREQRGEFIREL